MSAIVSAPHVRLWTFNVGNLLTNLSEIGSLDMLSKKLSFRESNKQHQGDINIRVVKKISFGQVCRLMVHVVRNCFLSLNDVFCCEKKY